MDETVSRNGNNPKMVFVTDDHDLRDTILKVRLGEIHRGFN